ncbi:hypothetical protein KKF55_01690 [Patescibacteria group bacterium]|nr:hypothetical protein [Patescibacteria group bacterium]
MYPFERPIRDLVLKKFEDDPETFQILADKELFTCALNRYLAQSARQRDMYRETIDDLIEAYEQKKQFSRFPPKHRHEGKYYTDHWRKGFDQESRLELYRLRRWILWELQSYDMIKYPRHFWQPIFIWNPYNLTRLRDVIGECEDRCFLCGHSIETRIEYDEVRHKLIEYSQQGESKVLRDFTPDKAPEKFIQCLFAHQGQEMTYDEVYELMGVKKKDRRIKRWRREAKLDKKDISGKYIRWIDSDCLVFSAEHRIPQGRDEDTMKYPFKKHQPTKIERICYPTHFRINLTLLGAKFNLPSDDLTKARR